MSFDGNEAVAIAQVRIVISVNTLLFFNDVGPYLIALNIFFASLLLYIIS